MTWSSLRLVLGLLFVGALAQGCASPGGGPEHDLAGGGDMGSDTLCKAGQTQSCFCLNGGQGTQVCRDNGMSYGTCTGCSGDGGNITIGDMQAGSPCGDCDGCCNGTTCVTYANQSNIHCGVAGTICGQCSSGTECDGTTGTCITAAADCTSCGNGCCGMLNGHPTCFVNNAGNCGTGDGTCTPCQQGTLCSNGACNNQLDPMAQFRVTVSKSQVYNTDGMGNCWDYAYGFFGCGQPDLQVCFAYDPGSGFVAGCTTSLTDVPVDNGLDGSDNNATDTGTWDSSDGLLKDGNGQVFYIPGSYFINGKVLVYVQDYDSIGSSELIGSEYIKGGTYFSGYMVGPYSRVVSVFFTLK